MRYWPGPFGHNLRATESNRGLPGRRKWSFRPAIEQLESLILLTASNQVFVDTLYQDLLHRHPEPSGLEFWTGVLAGNVSRDAVALGMTAATDEYRSDQVQSMFQDLLKRPADPAAFNHFLGLLKSGTTAEQARAEIMGSAEYFQNRAAQNTVGFVTAAYEDVFIRDPDTTGRTYYVDQLAHGLSRTELAQQMLGSTEYRRKVVEGYYEQFLFRTGERKGADFWLNKLEHNIPDENVLAGFPGEPEYSTQIEHRQPLAAGAPLAVPGQPGSTISTTFSLVGASAGSPDELGMFVVDAQGRVAGRDPGEPGYAQAALRDSSSRILFAQGAAPGNTLTVNLPAGSFLAFYLVQQKTTQRQLVHNPADQLGLKPMVYFSLPQANPDLFNHVQLRANNQFAFEDQTGGGSDDPANFNDLVVQVDFGSGPANESDPPVLRANLTNDTGTSASDRVTSDPAIGGMVTDASTIASFRAGFDGAATSAFVDVLADRQTDGSFAFSRARLEQMNAGPLANGPHVLHLQAADQFGNISSILDVPFTLDTTAPATGITSPAANLTTNANVRVTGKVTDSLAGVAALEWQLDGGAFAAVGVAADGGFSLPVGLALDGSADGTHVVKFRATDKAGNVSDLIPVSFVLDATAPMLVIVSPSSGSSSRSNVTVVGKITDNLSGIAQLLAQVDAGASNPVVLDQDGNYSFTTQMPVDGSADGTHTVRLQGADKAGNLSTAATLQFVLDTLAPTVTITSPLEGTFGQNNVTVAGQAVDSSSGVARLEAQMDSGSFADVTIDGTGRFSFPTTFPLDGSADGIHTVNLRATDGLGNVSAPVTVTFAIGAQAVLVENSIFRPGSVQSFVIPDQLSVLSFQYADPSFDTTDTKSIKDAFEAALVDSTGVSLVHTIAGSKDAFFNITEGNGPQTAPGASVNGHTVTVNLAGLTPGTQARLIFRLVNNDTDTHTSAPVPAGQIDPLPGEQPVAAVASSASTFSQISDFSTLSDITPSIQAIHGVTSFNDRTNVLYTDVALRNLGVDALGTPLVVVIDHLSDPTVRVRDADGVTPEGLPYYNFSTLVAGRLLAPGSTTGVRSLSFFNPNRIQFTYDLVVLGQLNRSPTFTSTPVTETISSGSYSYQATAVDPDGDPLTFGLLGGPAGMSVNPNSGQVLWNPTPSDVGSHVVVLRVEDGRGGTAEQRFVINVETPPPNRPPVFTSTPVITATAGVPYLYQAAAADPDSDALTFGVFSHSVVITNPGFEDPVLADGSYIGSLNGWDSSGNSGTFNVSGVYPGGAPGGKNIAYSTNTTISQVLSERVQPGTRYTLQADVGFLSGTFPGFALQLWAGGSLLAQDTSVVPAAGTFATARLQYDFSQGPALGQPLEIRLQPLGDSAEVHIDNVRLTATPILPQGMTIDAATGLIQWTPTAAQAHDTQVTVQVADERGGTAKQFFNIQFPLVPSDQPPSFVDLTADQVDQTGLAFEGQGLTVSGTIKARVTNTGSADVKKGFDVLFFEDRNGNNTFNAGIDTILGKTSVTDPILAGGSVTVSAALSGSILFTNNRIWAYVDSSQAIAETNENNNLAARVSEFIPPVGEFNPVVKWNKSTFSVRPDSDQVMMSPAVIDVNLDGVPDIVFSTFSGSDYVNGGLLRAISGDDGRELWTVDDPRYYVYGSGGIAVGDLDHDGYPEIIAESQSGNQLIAFGHDGSFKWISPGLERIDWGSAALADLDGDGTPEIVIGRTVLNADGTIRWVGRGNGHGAGSPGPLSAVADLDLDGVPEVVAGSSAYRADGSTYWNAPIPDGLVAVGNFDSDAFPEIVVETTNGGNLYLLEHDGTIKWGPIPIPGERWGEAGAPTIADMDGDGRLDIGIAAGELYTVFNDDGTVKWSQPVQDFSSAVTGSSVFDFDGDGKAEVVYGDERFLRIYRGSDGAVLYSVPKSSGTTYELPVIADINADGHSEIVAAANNYAFPGQQTGIFVIGDANDTWMPSRPIWNQQTYHITNVNDDGTIPAHEENSWQLYNSYRLNLEPDPLKRHLAPELTASYVLTAQTDGTTTYTARLGNGGSLLVRPGVNIAFYNGDPTDGGVFLGAVASQGVIEPGGYEDLTLTVDGAVGDLWVRADDGNGVGHVNEADETNNLYHPDLGVPPFLPGEIHGSVFDDTRPVSPSTSLVSSADGLIADGSVSWGVLGANHTAVSNPFSLPVSGLADLTVTVSKQDSTDFERRDGGTNGWSGNFLPGDELLWTQFGTQKAITLTFSQPIHGIGFQIQGDFPSSDPPPVFHLGSFTAIIEAFDANSKSLGRYTETGSLDNAEDGSAIFLGIYSTSPDIRQIVIDVLDPFGADFAINHLLIEQHPPLQGWTVYLDQNRNGRRDFGERLTTTDAFGNYAFTNLAPGHYFVQEEPMPGWSQTSHGNGASLILNGDFEDTSFSVLPDGSRRYTGWTESDVNGGEAGIFLEGTNGISIFDLINTQLDGDASLAPDFFFPYLSDAQPNLDHFGYARPSGPAPTDSYAEFISDPFVIDGPIQMDVWRESAQSDSRVGFFDADTHAELGTFTVTADPRIWTRVTFETSAFLGHRAYIVLHGGTNESANGWLTLFDNIYGGQRGQGAAGSGTEVALASGQIVTGIDFANIRSSGEVNRAPLFNSTPPTEGTVGQTLRYKASATDRDNDPLTFDLPVRPIGMTVDPSTGVLTWIPASGQVGTADVILRVTDGRGGVDLQSFQVVVSLPNNAPVITSTPPGPPVAGLPYRYTVQAQDADADPLRYTLTASPSGMTIDSASGVVSWTPSAAQIGDQAVTVQVSDGRGGVATQSFTLGVAADAVNRDPVIHSTPRTSLALGRSYSYAVDATDPDGDPLLYALDAAPEGMAIDSSGLLSWTPSATQFGANNVTVRVTDGRGGIALQSFVITVASQENNQPPAITSNPLVRATVGESYFYAPEGFDPDGDSVIWSLSTAPAGMSIDPGKGTILWAPLFDQLGANAVAIHLTDARGAEAVQTFTVTVDGNFPPNITSDPPTVAVVDILYQYAVKATDANGDPLTYSLTTTPAGMTIDPQTGVVQWTPTQAQADVGFADVEVGVEDGHGNGVFQSFTIVIQSTARNLPPVITSTPSFVASVGQPYQYAVVATDPENEALRYALTGAHPAGLTIHSQTGLLQWTPTDADVGPQQIALVVTDPQGAFASQTYTLSVARNHAPTIDSSPALTVVAGATYHYDIAASDADHDPLTFTLAQGPAGMSVDTHGRLSWPVGATAVGTRHVSLLVTDNRGATATQDFDLAIVPDSEAPKVSVSVTSNPVDVGDSVTFTVVATDNVNVRSLKLTLNGSPIGLDSNGRATVAMNQVGTIVVVASALDGAGNVGQASASLEVIDPTDTEAPEVDLTSPEADAILTARTDIIGTVTDNNLLDYVLEIARFPDGEFVEIGRGTAPVVNGVLGQFDPTTLLNDSYTLRLTAHDAGGHTATDERVISVAGNSKVGNFSLSFTDLSIPVSGIPITVTRTYDSLDASNQNELGFGWRFDISDTDLRTSVAKTGGEDDLLYNPFRNGTRVYITLPGGHREGFTFRPQIRPGYAGAFLGIYDATFEPDPGITDQLNVQQFPLSITDQGEALDYTTNEPFNPVSPVFGGTFLLTTKDGLAYTINGRTGHLVSVSDTNNNSLSFTDEGIISSAGPEVRFGRDAQGRITSIIDPLGKELKYQYDSLGNLVAVTDRQGNTTQFVYDQPDRPHYLTKVIDPLGRTGIRSEYDDQGRLVKLIDASGHAVQMIHDPGNATETVQDQLGNSTTYEYDDRGNIVTQIDALGGITRRTYDAGSNMLSETDPLGRTTYFTYDERGDMLTQTDPLGNVSYHTYQAFTYGTSLTAKFNFQSSLPFTRETTFTDALGNTTTSQFDFSGSLTGYVDALGYTTSFAYDASGNATSLTDGAGDAISLDYDGAGRVTRRVDASGHETTFTYDEDGNELTRTTTLTTPAGARALVTSTTYDADGRPISVTDAEGNITRTEYDAAGQKSAEIDALGRRTQFLYDERGELIETINADNTTTHLEYDAAGRQVASIDELGRRTEMKYDALGRLLATIYPDSTPNDDTDNPYTQSEYDAAGQVTAEIDERGNRTEFTYDAAGRQIAMRDALGNETLTTYDAAGRRIAATDALGHTTRYVVDAAGRTVETDFIDGTSVKNIFDARGQVTASIDQTGRVTHFEHDALGRLTAVVDALNQRTTYAYDEAGDLISQTDANGHVTHYEYDGLGRRTATVLPMGERSSTSYDAVGNVASATDFNGATIHYTYDARNRETLERLPEGSQVAFTYTLDGLRATATDARGVTRYAYDERGRLLSRTDPDGQAIRYTYDDAGNRTSVSTVAGTTTYTFDALNRIATVLDPASGVTQYVYDGVGSLIQTTLPNGTTESRAYDDLNRLVYLENDGPGGVISSYRYTLGPTGRRDSVTEDTGRHVDYTYDALDRLTLEKITDAVFGNRNIGYTYDAVGNRLTRDDDGEGSTTYAYDANDRLLTETLAGNVTAYTYDANGNTLSRVTSTTDQAAYHWDAQNRLAGADVTNSSGSQHISYQYDADGIRVASTTDGVETRFLVDTVQRYAQVALEYRPSGLVLASYVYGDQLLSETRNGAASYYHVDGLGSTRALTDVSGTVTDRYLYDAFGRMLSQTGSTANSYLFAGQQRDSATGLDYLRARYLSFGTGRFYGSDPFGGQTNSPGTLHRYSYAKNDPVNLIDPSGNFALTELAISGAAEDLAFNFSLAQIKGGIGAIRSLVTLLPAAMALQNLGLTAMSNDISGGETLYWTGIDLELQALAGVGQSFKKAYEDLADNLITIKVKFSISKKVDEAFEGINMVNDLSRKVLDASRTAAKWSKILGNVFKSTDAVALAGTLNAANEELETALNRVFLSDFTVGIFKGTIEKKPKEYSFKLVVGDSEGVIP
jgi:RHS repeat-associated protein